MECGEWIKKRWEGEAKEHGAGNTVAHRPLATNGLLCNPLLVVMHFSPVNLVRDTYALIYATTCAHTHSLKVLILRY